MSFIFSFFLFSFFSDIDVASKQSLTAEKLLIKHFDKINEKKYRSLQSLYIESEIREDGANYKLKIYKKREGKLRQEIITQTKTFLQVVNEGKAWTTDFAGRKMPMNEIQTARLADVAAIEPILVQAQANEVLLLEYDELKKTYALALNKENLDYRVWLNEDFLIDKLEMLYHDTNLRIMTKMSDYRMVESMLMAFHIEQTIYQGQSSKTVSYQVKKVEINRAFDDDIFEIK